MCSFFAVGYELPVLGYVYNACLEKTVLADDPYRVSLSLGPRTLHKEIQSLIFMKLFL